jgi:hypothetical protein
MLCRTMELKTYPLKSSLMFKLLFTARRLFLQACAVALTALPAAGGASPVTAQQACSSWDLTGEWSLTRTTAGANMSLRGGTLVLVHRGSLVVGRWAPGGGEEDNLPARGSFQQGVLRLAVEGGSKPLHLLLQISSDGMLLKGRWNAGSPGVLVPGDYGELFLQGEAACREGPEADGIPPGGEPAAEFGRCERWDLTGDWQAAFEGAPHLRTEWRLHLVQSGRNVLGWYEHAAAAAPRRWLVEGEVNGRVLTLTHHYPGGSTLKRHLLLDASGTMLRGPWPVQFGLLGDEVLTGQARCLAQST